MAVVRAPAAAVPVAAAVAAPAGAVPVPAGVAPVDSMRVAFPAASATMVTRSPGWRSASVAVLPFRRTVAPDASTTVRS